MSIVESGQSIQVERELATPIVGRDVGFAALSLLNLDNQQRLLGEPGFLDHEARTATFSAAVNSIQFLPEEDPIEEYIGARDKFVVLGAGLESEETTLQLMDIDPRVDDFVIVAASDNKGVIANTLLATPELEQDGIVFEARSAIDLLDIIKTSTESPNGKAFVAETTIKKDSLGTEHVIVELSQIEAAREVGRYVFETGCAEKENLQKAFNLVRGLRGNTNRNHGGEEVKKGTRTIARSEIVGILLKKKFPNYTSSQIKDLTSVAIMEIDLMIGGTQ